VSELLAGLLGVLIGGLSTHRFSLGRDKRKEYNEAVAPFLEFLLHAEEQARNGHLWVKWNDEDLIKIQLRLSNKKIIKLNELVKLYKESTYKAYPVNKEKPWEGSGPIKEELENTVKIIQNMKILLKLQ
jgi:hypothetical protein